MQQTQEFQYFYSARKRKAVKLPKTGNRSVKAYGESRDYDRLFRLGWRRITEKTYEATIAGSSKQ